MQADRYPAGLARQPAYYQSLNHYTGPLMAKSNGSGTPTCPTEKTQTGDRLSGRVYYIPEADLFLTIEAAAPGNFDWTVTELYDGRIVMDLYDGQNFIGTANILEFYKLDHSEQWRPQRPRRR